MPWWIPETFRRIGVFLLAVLVAFTILVLITLPLAFAMWLLLKYAAGQ